jgi:hypothetical protein
MCPSLQRQPPTTPGFHSWTHSTHPTVKREPDESQHQPLLAEHLLAAPHSHPKHVLSKQMALTSSLGELQNQNNTTNSDIQPDEIHWLK